MAQLVVRNIEAEVKSRLQLRAKRHRRSLEEEIRNILRNAAREEGAPHGGLGTEIAEHRGHEIREHLKRLRTEDLAARDRSGYTEHPQTSAEVVDWEIVAAWPDRYHKN